MAALAQRATPARRSRVWAMPAAQFARQASIPRFQRLLHATIAGGASMDPSQINPAKSFAFSAQNNIPPRSLEARPRPIALAFQERPGQMAVIIVHVMT